MNDQNESMELKLDFPAEPEMKPQSGMSAPEAPSITLEQAADIIDKAPAIQAPQANPLVSEYANLRSIVAGPKLDDSALSDEEKQQVAVFSQKIDIKNTAQIMQFGSGAQKKLAGFSEQALANVRAKDVDAVGEMITGLVVELQGFSIEEGKKPGLFRRARNHLAEAKSKYDSVEKNVDRIVLALEQHKVTLLKDVAILDQMYERNLHYYKELTMYILAGRARLAQVINEEMPKLYEKAQRTGLAEDAQVASNMADLCNRFDKKLHDLELTRMVSIQMSPQIRLVQSSNAVMIEKIHSTIVNTIPLWKNQMVLALGMAHTQSAIRAQQEVTNLTNQLLRKNADALKINTIEAAKASERSIVDIETLKHTNQSLISTLDEVLRIQTEGRQKRREAEVELRNIEGELKQKLLAGASGANTAIAEEGSFSTEK
jgi:uncharacterized protein YaaN involved in tellurite resistance